MFSERGPRRDRTTLPRFQTGDELGELRVHHRDLGVLHHVHLELIVTYTRARGRSDTIDNPVHVLYVRFGNTIPVYDVRF